MLQEARRSPEQTWPSSDLSSSSVSISFLLMVSSWSFYWWAITTKEVHQASYSQSFSPTPIAPSAESSSPVPTSVSAMPTAICFAVSVRKKPRHRLEAASAPNCPDCRDSLRSRRPNHSRSCVVFRVCQVRIRLPNPNHKWTYQFAIKRTLSYELSLVNEGKKIETSKDLFYELFWLI